MIMWQPPASLALVKHESHSLQRLRSTRRRDLVHDLEAFCLELSRFHHSRHRKPFVTTYVVILTVSTTGLQVGRFCTGDSSPGAEAGGCWGTHPLAPSLAKRGGIGEQQPLLFSPTLVRVGDVAEEQCDVRLVA